MSATFALQKAVYAALVAFPAVSALVGTRVFDRVTAGQAMPYIHLRAFQEVDDSNGCGDAWEVFADIDVWSDAVGKPQAAQVAGAIRDALHEADLVLEEPYALVGIRHRDTDIGDGGDGLMTRARLTFRALVERA